MATKVTIDFNLEKPKHKRPINVDNISKLVEYKMKSKKKFRLLTDDNKIQYCHKGSGLINAVIQAYNNHEHLELCPDETILDKPKSVCDTSTIDIRNIN